MARRRVTKRETRVTYAEFERDPGAIVRLAQASGPVTVYEGKKRRITISFPKAPRDEPID